MPSDTSRIAFKRPLFLPKNELQVTVRLGTKWFTAFHINNQQTVKLVSTKNEYFGEANLCAAYYLHLDMLHERWFTLMPDLKKPNWENLLKQLKSQYGDYVNGNTYVTVLFFARNYN
jgi:hypothetical protein